MHCLFLSVYYFSIIVSENFLNLYTIQNNSINSFIVIIWIVRIFLFDHYEDITNFVL